MGTTLPYTVSPGSIEKLLTKIKEAQTPPRFTQDFLGTAFGMSGGSNTPLIPLLKKLGFLGSDGVPTEAYKKFRNASISGLTMANAIRHAYKDLYARNEYAHKLTREKLVNLIMEITGAAHDSSVVKQTVGTYEALKRHANFESSEAEVQQENAPKEDLTQNFPPSTHFNNSHNSSTSALGLNLSYTINLNLPASSDIAVFNAIFQSLKENLLQS